MPHVLSNPESTIGRSYLNAGGHAECVELVRQTLHAPPTALWKEGKKVSSSDTTISKGTAIATFVNGKYPQNRSTGMHAAIYVGQNAIGIQVLDQFRGQPIVKPRTIRWNGGPSLSRNGSAFSVIEW